MFTAKMYDAKSKALADAIAAALSDRYYGTSVVGFGDDAIVCTHYDVQGAEWEFQNGSHTRYIRVFYGTICDDIDDYFESFEDEAKFAEVEAAYARLCPPAVEEPCHTETCDLVDEDIPF